MMVSSLSAKCSSRLQNGWHRTAPQYRAIAQLFFGLGQPGLTGSTNKIWELVYL